MIDFYRIPKDDKDQLSCVSCGSKSNNFEAFFYDRTKQGSHTLNSHLVICRDCMKVLAKLIMEESESDATDTRE